MRLFILDITGNFILITWPTHITSQLRSLAPHKPCRSINSWFGHFFHCKKKCKHLSYKKTANSALLPVTFVQFQPEYFVFHDLHKTSNHQMLYRHMEKLICEQAKLNIYLFLVFQEVLQRNSRLPINTKDRMCCLLQDVPAWLLIEKNSLQH